MKKLTKVIAVLLALTLALGGLTGCGGKKDSADSDPAESNADISTSGKKHAGSSDDPYPLTDALLKYRIWYETDTNFAKDTKVKTVYVFDNDSVRRYSMNDLGVTYTMGEFSRMTDEEIVAALESAYQTYAENISAQLTPVIQELETMLNGDYFSKDYIVEIDLSNNAYEPLTPYIQEQAIILSGEVPKELPKVVLHCDLSGLRSEAESLYEMYTDYLERLSKNHGANGFDRAVFTDSSGNAVQFETIRISYETFSSRLGNEKLINSFMNLGAIDNITSYDSYTMVCNVKVANMDDILRVITGSDISDKRLDMSESIIERNRTYDVYTLGSWSFNTIYESTYNCYYYGNGLLSARADEMFYVTPDSMDASGILVDPTDW